MIVINNIIILSIYFVLHSMHYWIECITALNTLLHCINVARSTHLFKFNVLTYSNKFFYLQSLQYKPYIIIIILQLFTMLQSGLIEPINQTSTSQRATIINNDDLSTSTHEPGLKIKIL